MILSEFETLEAADFNESENTFTGVKGLGLVSKNGYNYRSAAVEEAIKGGKYDRVVVYMDHKKGPRSYADRLGEFVNPKFQEGLRGDFKINPKHPLAETVIWDIKNRTQGVGFSHSIDGDLAKDGKMVEAINKVYSIDLVSGPATTKTLYESETFEESEAVKKLLTEVETLKTEKTKLEESLKAEIVALKTELLKEIEKVKTYKHPIAKDTPLPPLGPSSYDDFVKRLVSRS